MAWARGAEGANQANQRDYDWQRKNEQQDWNNSRAQARANHEDMQYANWTEEAARIKDDRMVGDQFNQLRSSVQRAIAESGQEPAAAWMAAANAQLGEGYSPRQQAGFQALMSKHLDTVSGQLAQSGRFKEADALRAAYGGVPAEFGQRAQAFADPGEMLRQTEEAIGTKLTPGKTAGTYSLGGVDVPLYQAYNDIVGSRGGNMTASVANWDTRNRNADAATQQTAAIEQRRAEQDRLTTTSNNMSNAYTQSLIDATRGAPSAPAASQLTPEQAVNGMPKPAAPKPQGMGGASSMIPGSFGPTSAVPAMPQAQPPAQAAPADPGQSFYADFTAKKQALEEIQKDFAVANSLIGRRSIDPAAIERMRAVLVQRQSELTNSTKALDNWYTSTSKSKASQRPAWADQLGKKY